ncbi:MAG: MGMT family protein [Treponema sp.]|jgi:methylated-DNA-protein-cysteine methyltransferase-like protein|nr:MGMT family protein [Treponema sp.]
MAQTYETKPYTVETLRIIEAIQAVPAGRVSSYRDIAGAAGLPNGARQVARILHSLASSQNLPWHRIIKANGRIALPPGQGRELQIQLLRSEGVTVSDEGVVTTPCGARPPHTLSELPPYSGE